MTNSRKISRCPVPGRGPAVEKHYFIPKRVTHYTTQLLPVPNINAAELLCNSASIPACN